MCRNDHGRYTVDADDEVTYHADGQYELNDKKIPIAPSNCCQDVYLIGPDDEHVLDDDAPVRIPSVCSRCWIRCKYFTTSHASVHWCTFFAFLALCVVTFLDALAAKIIYLVVYAGLLFITYRSNRRSEKISNTTAAKYDTLRQSVVRMDEDIADIRRHDITVQAPVADSDHKEAAVTSIPIVINVNEHSKST